MFFSKIDKEAQLHLYRPNDIVAGKSDYRKFKLFLDLLTRELKANFPMQPNGIKEPTLATINTASEMFSKGNVSGAACLLAGEMSGGNDNLSEQQAKDLAQKIPEMMERIKIEFAVLSKFLEDCTSSATPFGARVNETYPNPCDGETKVNQILYAIDHNTTIDPITLQHLLTYIQIELFQKMRHDLYLREREILNALSVYDIWTFYLDTHYAQVHTYSQFAKYSPCQDNDCRNDPQLHPNAFKHAYLAGRRTKSHGAGLALLLVGAHEEGMENYNPAEIGTMMDKRNNSIGIEFSEFFVGEKGDLINLFYNMAKNGQLWTVNTNVTPNVLHKISF